MESTPSDHRREGCFSGSSRGSVAMGIYLKGLVLYPALVRCEGGIYRADVIDIPGCRAYGASACEAEAKVGEALNAHVARLGRDGRALPTPSVIEQAGSGADRYFAYIAAPLP